MSPLLCKSIQLCLLLLLPAIRVYSRTDPGDLRALRDLAGGIDRRSIRNGSCLATWDLTFALDPCDRLFSERFTCGLRCDHLDPSTNLSRVTEVTLDAAGYSGSLLASSTSGPWSLPHLRTLDLSGNSLSGPIPSALFSDLPRMAVLSLSTNSLSGRIPDSIASVISLEELYLDGNSLSGPIPSAISNLTKMNRLELQSNQLTGSLPNLTSLESLYLLDASNNRLSSEVPAALPPSLVELSLRENHLTGTIRASLGDSSRFLQVLDLSHNNLTGAIPSTLFDHPSLEQVTLSNNNFTSVQSPASRALQGSKLIALDLSYNELGGFLPPFLALMPKLSALSLEQNRFTGMIPTQYALRVAGVFGPVDGAARFERLLLAGNYLFGPVPGVFMRLRPSSANVSVVDNCLYRCPEIFFFCQGRDQKSWAECRRFNPVIP
ncbi:hypothetical protein SAY86_004426 [Trapa natans]|uniref:Uncharacterized protein n=1 Tax=Trapa natans TaxID=22666 RepID=A0AAN7MFK8_TRANT|nr:hypothetical protein SAY86_004426 [Trapa natans]